MTDVPLKHLCSLPPEYGLNITPDRYRDEGVRLLRTSDIATGGGVRDSGGVFLDAVDVPAEMLLRDGDLLFSRSGTLGRALLYSRDQHGEATFAGFLVRFRLRRGIDPRAIRYWSESAPFVGTVASEAIQSTISNFNADRYANLAVPTWLVEHSAAVAEYLDAEIAHIDGLLEARRRQAKLLLDHRRAVIDGLSVPVALGGRADIESAWPVAKLKRAAAFFADGDWIESPFITADGIRLIQTGNIGEGIYRDQGFRYISDETFETLGCTEVLPGDILISRLAGTVGRSCLAPDLGTRMVVSVDVVIMRPVLDLHPAFAVAYLSSSYHLALAELLARGTTMPRLSRSQVGELPIPMPPLAVQRRVVGEIERRLSGVNALQLALDLQVVRLLERRQALITAAVTGQVEIPGAAA